MKKLSFVLLSVLISLFILGQAHAAIINSADIGGFGTFQDLNTGRVWLDMNNFFNQSSTSMISAASTAGFAFATKADVQQLLGSLPLTGSEWTSYKSIMGDAPNRELIWGSYDYGTPNMVGWAWSYGNASWTILDSAQGMGGIDFVPNGGTPDADMNIWAYQQGQTPVIPEPATMSLLGMGLLGLLRFRRKAA